MKTKTLLFNFCFLVLISIQTGFSQGKEWSQFRGENSSGIAAKDATPPIEFGETQNLHWRINVPVGSSSPVIWDDQIYITAYDEENSNLETICLDRNSGIILWKDVIHPDKFETPHPLGNPASSSATVDEDGVYIYFSSYGLKCMSHEGESRWDYPMPVPEKVLYGHPTSPVLMDDKLILRKDYGNDDTRCLMAFDKSTGQVIWKSMIGKNTPINANGFPGYSTPVRLKNQIIIHRCGGIASYSLDNGSPIWWIKMRTTGVSTPVLKDDVVYVGAWSELSEKERRGDIFNYSSFDTLINDFDKNSDQLIEWDEIPENMMIFSRPEINDIEDTQISVRRAFNGIDANKDGYINKEEWERRINLMSQFVQDVGVMALPANKTGELTFEDIIWMQSGKNPEVPSPILDKDIIYYVKNGGWVSCADLKNGEIYFSEKLGAGGACIASPILANGYIYLPSYNGSITIIKEGKNPDVVYNTKLEGKITATPAVYDNNLYIRTSEYLYAFSDEVP